MPELTLGDLYSLPNLKNWIPRARFVYVNGATRYIFIKSIFRNIKNRFEALNYQLECADGTQNVIYIHRASSQPSFSDVYI